MTKLEAASEAYNTGCVRYNECARELEAAESRVTQAMADVKAARARCQAASEECAALHSELLKVAAPDRKPDAWH